MDSFRDDFAQHEQFEESRRGGACCHGFINRSPERTRTSSLISYQLEYNARRGDFTRQCACVDFWIERVLG